MSSIDSNTLRQRLIYGLMDLENKSPMFSVAVCWLLNIDLVHKEGAIAATNGVSMFYSDEFLELPRKGQEFVALHEAFHGVNRHIQQIEDMYGKDWFRKKSRNWFARVNAAMDIWINEVSASLIGTPEEPYYPMKDGKPLGLFKNHMVKSSTGKMVHLLPKHKELDPNVHDWYWIYTNLYREWDGNGAPDDLEEGGGEGAETVAGRAISQGTMRAEAEALRKNHTWGSSPEWLNILLQLKAKSKVRWQENLRQTFNGSLPVDYSMRRFNKSYLGQDCYVGTISRPGMGTLVFGIDTSGSVTAELMEQPVAEVQAIVDDVQPEKVYQVWADAGVANVQELGPGDRLDPKPCGGGGTDFRPLFDWVNDNGVYPDYIIYATDGYGTFPDKAPKGCEVIWLVMKGGMRDGYPFGRVIYLDE